MARRHTTAWAAALGAGLLLALTACGGSGQAAASKGGGHSEVEQLESLATQVQKMGIIEWRGQLLTTSPDNGGKRIIDLAGRFSPSTGYTSVSMDSALDGKKQQVDYLVVADRTYFNSDLWGPNAEDCWVDITNDKEGRRWGLPSNLDPTWPVTSSHAVRMLPNKGIAVGVPAKAVLLGMPRGLFPDVPAAVEGIEAKALVSPHNHLIEVGVDIESIWSAVPADQLAKIETRKTGWWAMTMKESRDDSSVAPPKYVFDPAVTPPTQCKRA